MDLLFRNARVDGRIGPDLDAPTPLEVMRLKPVGRWVVRRGRIIAETTPPETRLRGEPVTFTAPAG